MKSKFVKAMAAGMAIAAMGGTAMPVFAAGTPTTVYTAVQGKADQATLTKYLVLDSEAKVPTETFAYTITSTDDLAKAAAAKTADAAGTLAIYAGTSTYGVTGTPTIADIKFAPTDTASSTVDAADAKTTKGGLTLDAGQSYVKKTTNIDFSGVTFSEPGVYRWKVDETDSKAQGVSYDVQAPTGAAKLTRYLDVYVVDKDGALSVDSCVLHATADDVTVNANGGSDAYKADTDAKSDGYVNSYTTYNLTVSKAVAGNQASRDKYFQFTVNFKNSAADTVLPVEITGDNASADATVGTNAATKDDYEGKTNPTEVKIGDDGTGTATFYLHNNQKIRIDGITTGTAYTVTEAEEDYTPAIAVTGDTTNAAADDIKAVSADTVTDAGLTADTTVAFTNTKEGTVPTGVILGMAPYIVAAGIAGIGGTAVAVNKKKNKKNED